MTAGRRTAKPGKEHIALYLSRYAEVEAQTFNIPSAHDPWEHVLVVPAYREGTAFLQQAEHWHKTLLIVVLNRPDSDADTRCNDSLRDAIRRLPAISAATTTSGGFFQLSTHCQLLLLERGEALPRQEGVGLARKLGCDVALALHAAGRIIGPWIHSSDADALLPADYFEVPRAHGSSVAISYPFRHRKPDNARERLAIELYEERLQRYVDGLTAAGSPYAFHTLGSCLAIRGDAYAQVRGFPRRAGGEDFYLLNKLAKVGAIASAASQPIELSARLSDRVPFGTGPALASLLEQEILEQATIFYHPCCFTALKSLLEAVVVHGRPGVSMRELAGAAETRAAVESALISIGMERFLHHANTQCADGEAFRRQFHQWFDGFRTLKFIHALGERWSNLSKDSPTLQGR